MHLGKGCPVIPSLWKRCNEWHKFWSKKKNKWFLPNVIFLPFLYPYISAGLDSINAGSKAQLSWERQDRMKDMYGNSLFCTEMQLGQSTGVLTFSTEEREFRHPEDRFFMRRRSQNDRTWSNSSSWAGPPRASCHLEPLKHLPHFLPQLVIQLLLSYVLWLLKRV